MTRPDGSFYVHPKHKATSFAMVFANPDKATGEPIKSSLKGFVFRNGKLFKNMQILISILGQAIKLSAGIWHTVPIPLFYEQEGGEFREIIAETNANIVINLKFECNRPLTFHIFK